MLGLISKKYGLEIGRNQTKDASMSRPSGIPCSVMCWRGTVPFGAGMGRIVSGPYLMSPYRGVALSKFHNRKVRSGP